MAINFGYEMRAFDKRQHELHIMYVAAGMTEEQMASMYEFDRKQFWRDMAYYRRSESLFEESAEQYACLFYEAEEASHTKYWWINELNNTGLYYAVVALTPSELELLDMVVIQGYTQRYMSAVLQVCPNAVSKRMKKILSKLYCGIERRGEQDARK